MITFPSLTSIQIGDTAFAELLSRLRTNEQTEADLELLENRVINDSISQPPRFRICRRTMNVALYNDAVFKLHGKTSSCVLAVDSFPSDFDSFEKTDEQKLRRSVAALPKNKTANLELNLEIAVGLRYMLTTNIDTDDRLCNGKTGMLMQVGYSGSNVSVLYILFDDPNAGVNHRRKHKQLPGLDCQN